MPPLLFIYVSARSFRRALIKELNMRACLRLDVKLMESIFCVSCRYCYEVFLNAQNLFFIVFLQTYSKISVVINRCHPGKLSCANP